MHSIAKNSIYNTIYNLVNLIFPLIVSMYISRVILPEGVGRVAYVQNIASYFVSFAVLSMPAYGVREIAKTGTDQVSRNRVFTELVILNTITTLISTAAYLVVTIGVEHFRADQYLFLCFGLQVFMNILNIDWLYQGLQDYAYITKRNIVIKILSTVAMFVFVKDRDDYIVYAFISILSLTANYLFNVYHARRFVAFDFSSINPQKHIRTLLILGIGVILSGLYNKVDITMLGIMASEKTVGLYTNAHKIIHIIITLCVSVSTVFLPQLSLLYERDKKAFLELITYGVQIIAFFAIPSAVGVFLLAPEMMEIMFGTAFAGAGVTMRIFAILIVIVPFGDLLCYQLIIITGNEKKRIPAYLIAAAANVILNLLLIPPLLQNGAAIASVISELLVNGIQFIIIIKLLHLKMPLKPVAEAIISSGVMAVGVIAAENVLQRGIFRTICSVLIGVSIYTICNLVIRNEFSINVFSHIKKRKI